MGHVKDGLLLTSFELVTVTKAEEGSQSAIKELDYMFQLDEENDGRYCDSRNR